MTNVIYIGANLNRGEVRTNQLFTERPAELIARFKEKFPLIEFLFVPVTIYSAVLKELHTAGSIYAKAYAQTKEG